MSEKVTTLPKQAVSIETIVIVGIFTALSAVISALPIGIKILGVPATLQTFAMAFLGFALGPVLGTASCGIYILMGLIGLPVYNGYTSGPGVLFGITGGFLFGFLFLSFLSGVGMKFTKKDYYFNDVLKKQVLFTHEKTPSELSSQGIGWYADLAGWHLTPKNSEGYGHFLLVPKKTIKTGSIQLYANYAHALAGGIGISIKGVSVSFTGSHDKQATSKTINLQRGTV